MGLAVAMFVNSRTLSSYVSADAITKVTALSDRAVRAHLLLLIDEGWLTATHLRRGNGWKLRQFTIQLPAGVPAKMAGPTDPEAPAKNDVSTGKKRREYRQNPPTNSDKNYGKNSESANGAAAAQGAAPPARTHCAADEKRQRDLEILADVMKIPRKSGEPKHAWLRRVDAANARRLAVSA